MKAVIIIIIEGFFHASVGKETSDEGGAMPQLSLFVRAEMED